MIELLTNIRLNLHNIKRRLRRKIPEKDRSPLIRLEGFSITISESPSVDISPKGFTQYWELITNYENIPCRMGIGWLWRIQKRQLFPNPSRRGEDSPGIYQSINLLEAYQVG